VPPYRSGGDHGHQRALSASHRGRRHFRHRGNPGHDHEGEAHLGVSVWALWSPQALKTGLSFNDPRDHSVTLPKENFANRDPLSSVMFRAGMIGRGRYDAGSIELMKQLVTRNLGVALATRVGLETELLLHIPLHQGRGLITLNWDCMPGPTHHHRSQPKCSRIICRIR
jgi:DNA-binding transcriptional LysR family regulator